MPVDLSKLSDEQLDAYQSLRERQAHQNDQPAAPKAPIPQALSPQSENPYDRFGREHPYISAGLAMVPGIGMAAPNAEETGIGAAKQLGRDAYRTLTSPAVGPLGIAADYALNRTGVTPRVMAATEPRSEGQQAGGVLTTAAETALPLPPAIEALPSTARAGRMFEAAKAAAKDVPVDVSRFAEPVLRARELKANANVALPSVMRAAMRHVAPTTEPLTYGVARDIASEAGQRAVRMAEAPRVVSKPMMAQVSKLSKGLDVANEEAAAKAGVGDIYRQAMTEHRRAKQIEDAGQVAKKAAIGAALLGGGVEGARHIARRVLGGGQ